MSATFLLKNILLIDPATKTEKRSDVQIIDGRIVNIAEIGQGLSASATGTSISGATNLPVIDVSGCWLTPGLIDMHTHLRDFAESDKETIASGTKAAAAGGFTTVLAMANSKPPLDSVPQLTVLLKKIEENACIEVLPACCVTRGMQGTELTDMVELASLGAAAFTDDGKPIMNLEVLRRALEYSKLTGRIIISHAEDSNLSAGGSVHKSAVAVQLGLPMIPGCSESASIAREVEIAKETGQRLHFAHVSMARSVELIKAAQAAGIAVTGDVTPHHLALTVDDIAYNTSFKMNPPLRTKSDIVALISGVVDGTLMAIATDHAPHTRLEKSTCFDCAPLGVLGLETAFPLTLEVLVHSKKISALKFIELLTTGPANILGIQKPTLQPGSGNFVILDPQHEWTYKATEGYSRSSNSPFDGRKLTGKVIMTMYQGVVVHQDTDHKFGKELAQESSSKGGKIKAAPRA